MNRLSQNKLKCALPVAAVLTIAVFSGAATATPIGGIFQTDRFGYTGEVNRYGTLADAQGRVNSTDTIAIGVDVDGDDSREHRDAGMQFQYNAGAYDAGYSDDLNYLSGSWWYSTHANGGGWGNINGNTGIGFMQLYDEDGSTDTSISMDFSNFDGTHWTDFTLSVEGENLDPYSRFSVYDNVHDGGEYLEYALNITATGLEGVEAGDQIVATNHATGVNGTFTGLFRLGGDPNGDLNTDWYTIDLDYDMENWAFANNGSLTPPYENGGNIYDSLFVAAASVPEPSTIAIFAAGLLGSGFARRRKA
jgi:hypothetical protein